MAKKRHRKSGILPVEEGKKLTQMDYEVYPEALEHVIRRVHKEMPNVPIMITENGIGTSDDKERMPKESLRVLGNYAS